MKKLVLLTLFFAFILSACGGVKATVGSDPYSKQTQAIVEKWIAALNNRDATALVSLYSNDYTLRDCSLMPCDVETTLPAMKEGYAGYFNDPNFKMKIQSYFVTAYGRFVIIQGIYDDKSEFPTPSPLMILLEIKNGLILNETMYYLSYYIPG
jgi:hypothetical protein